MLENDKYSNATLGIVSFLFWLFTAGSATLSLMLLFEIFAETSTLTNLFLGTVLMFYSPNALLFFWRRKLKLKKDQYLRKQEELLVLRIAEQSGGILNAANLSVKAGIDIEKSTQLLEKMAINGIAQSQINDLGFVEFKFPELIN